MKNLPFIFVLIGTAIGSSLTEKDNAAAVTPCYAYGFVGYFQSGSYYFFQDYFSDLSIIGFNDRICSAVQTGMWMYYVNINYNSLANSQVLWVHGVDMAFNFPIFLCGATSSLKYGGNHLVLNEDSYTLYTGEYFAGVELYGNADSPNLSVVNGAASSLILTGLSPWTFYTGFEYAGVPYCFNPGTDVDVGSDGTVLNFGIFISFAAIGAPDNQFYSVRKGCFSDTIFKAPQLKAEERFKHGAWGVIDTPQNNE